jgi:hypothetical protein
VRALLGVDIDLPLPAVVIGRDLDSAALAAKGRSRTRRGRNSRRRVAGGAERLYMLGAWAICRPRTAVAQIISTSCT